jgi:hypothetical protein
MFTSGRQLNATICAGCSESAYSSSEISAKKFQDVRFSPFTWGNHSSGVADPVHAAPITNIKEIIILSRN